MSLPSLIHLDLQPSVVEYLLNLVAERPIKEGVLVFKDIEAQTKDQIARHQHREKAA